MQLVSSDQAVPATCQHTSPCADCPWARKSLNGWLGGASIDWWLQAARGEGVIPCHALTGAQCAGAAIFRRHICKLPRDRDALKLPADQVKVFAHDAEFRDHHSASPADKIRRDMHLRSEVEAGSGL